jgi:hypothetical protein
LIWSAFRAIRSTGLKFFLPWQVASAKTEPEPSADPPVAAAQAQIEIARQAALADAEIKRLKAHADIEIAQWKARQWAEVERFKAGLKAELAAVGTGAAGPERSRGVSS